MSSTSLPSKYPSGFYSFLPQWQRQNMVNAVTRARNHNAPPDFTPSPGTHIINVADPTTWTNEFIINVFHCIFDLSKHEHLGEPVEGRDRNESDFIRNGEYRAQHAKATNVLLTGIVSNCFLLSYHKRINILLFRSPRSGGLKTATSSRRMSRRHV